MESTTWLLAEAEDASHYSPVSPALLAWQNPPAPEGQRPWRTVLTVQTDTEPRQNLATALEMESVAKKEKAQARAVWQLQAQRLSHLMYLQTNKENTS